MSLFKVHHASCGSGYNAISTAEARSTRDILDNITKEYNTNLEGLKTACKLSATQWSGPARDAFANRIDSDIAKFRAFIGLIEEYQQTLLNIVKQYQQTEQENVNIVRN